MRAVTLYLANLRSFLSRVRLDFGRELTVLIASAVLFATFFYVFNDFLNVQVSSLSRPMRDRFAEVAAGVVLALGTAIAARSLRAERVEVRGFSCMARALGEEPGVVRGFLLLRGATVIAVAHGLAWYVCRRYLLAPNALVELPMLLASLGLMLVPAPEERAARAAVHEFAPLARLLGPVGVWRLKQLAASRPAKVCGGLSLVFVALAAWASFRAAPPFVAAAAALAGGMIAAMCLAFQMAEDLGTAWTERAFGVAHDDFILAYEKVGALIGLVLFVLVIAVAGPKAAACAAVAPVITPQLLLQIDGRRPAVNAMLIVIVSLFIGTAVFAHWLSLVLLLVLRHYALKTQAGRFYRA
jgi:hypothetical protein